MTHTEREDNPWVINVPDHAERTDSPTFTRARAVAQKIMETLKAAPYGPGPWQMHHGGSLWTYDDQRGWFLLLNTFGAEWSAQFCADPAKMELARQNALRQYSGFPKTTSQFETLGYSDGASILNTPITTAAQVAIWVDSIFNACVPLAAPVHLGTVSGESPHGGYHHYPKPIADIQFFKYDDFTLWVTDPGSGHPVAVVPASPRGSGDARVEVVYAAPGTALHEAHVQAHAAGRRLLLAPDSPLAREAFASQTAGAASDSTVAV